MATQDKPLDPTVATPPVAKRIPVETRIHGDTLVDEYAWLRGKEKPEVLEYLEAENAYAAAVMRPTEALQAKLYKEILGRIQETDLSVPSPKRGWLYYTRTEKGKDYAIRCRKRGPRGKEEVFLDENELAKGKAFFSVGDVAVSDDGNLLAFTTDETGYRQYRLHVKDLRSGKMLPDTAERVDAVVWAADNRTLFYVQEDAVSKRSNRLYRMQLGDNAATLIKEEPDGLFDIFLGKTKDDRFITLGSGSKDSNDVWIVDSARPLEPPKQLFALAEKTRYRVEHNGSKFFVTTDKDAKNFRVVSMPDSGPDRTWTEVVPHNPSIRIGGISMFKNFIAVGDRENGLPGIRVVDLRTGKIRRLKFDDAVYSVGLSGNDDFDTDKARYFYSSPVRPTEVVELDMARDSKAVLKKTPVPNFDPGQYATERIWARAKDGTRVPMGVVYRKDKKRKSMPTYLYGYGAYGSSQSFGFSNGAISLLDRGFLYVRAQIRGGGDMGEQWYEDGKMAHKMNTFTDFIACADHLVDSGWSDRSKLAISGGSAGGLLIGATLNLRPDLCRVAILDVPFVDVINTMLDESIPLTTQEFIEWGNPKMPEQYRWMRAYSPYDNIRKASYPAMFVETSLNDSQVGYHEPAKYVARMRATRTDGNPLVFRCYMAGGHGGASGRYDSLKQAAYSYAFTLAAMGIWK